MIALDDTMLIVVFCRGRETRPTAPEPIDSAELVFKIVDLFIAMSVELVGRGKARPTAPEPIDLAVLVFKSADLLSATIVELLYRSAPEDIHRANR